MTNTKRRWFLSQCGVGLGSIALTQLLTESGYAAPAAVAPADPLAPRKPHFEPRAKRVIFLFMAGAPSHLELFDNKPQLAKFDKTGGTFCRVRGGDLCICAGSCARRLHRSPDNNRGRNWE